MTLITPTSKCISSMLKFRVQQAGESPPTASLVITEKMIYSLYDDEESALPSA